MIYKNINKLLFYLLVVFMILGSTGARAQTNTLTLSSGIPAPVNFISVNNATGTPVATTQCFYVVAIYPIGESSPAGPSCIDNAVQSGTIQINWNGLPGTTGYHLLNANSRINPLSSGSCSACRIVTNTTNTSFTWNLAAGGAYTPSPASAAISTTVLDNLSFTQARVVNNLLWQFNQGIQFSDNSIFSFVGSILHKVTGITDINDNRILTFTPTANSVNSFVFTNAATGGEILLSSASSGADANAPFGISSNGTGNIDFFTGNGARKQFSIADSAAPTANIQVTGGTTGITTQTSFMVVPGVTQQGINFIATGVGTTNSAFHFFNGGNAVNELLRIVGDGTKTPVNFASIVGTATGADPQITSVNSSDASIGMQLISKAGGSVKLTDTGNTNPGLSVLGVASAINGFLVTPAVTTAPPVIGIGTTTDANVGMRFTPKGNGAFGIRPTTNTGDTASFVGVASAVNGFLFTPTVTGGVPFISSAVTGADANSSIGISSNGTGQISFFTGNGSRTQFTITDTASAVNNIQATGAPTSSSPSFTAVGSDTNLGIRLVVKGTGAIVTTAPSLVAGNVPTLNNAAGQTLTVAQVLNNVLVRQGAGAGVTDTTPTAAALVAAVAGCQANSGTWWIYRNSSANSITLAGGTNVTLAAGNTNTIATLTARQFFIQFTNCTGGSEAVTMFSVGDSTF